MNPKITIVLAVVLVALAAAYFFTGQGESTLSVPGATATVEGASSVSATTEKSYASSTSRTPRRCRRSSSAKRIVRCSRPASCRGLPASISLPPAATAGECPLYRGVGLPTIAAVDRSSEDCHRHGRPTEPNGRRRRMAADRGHPDRPERGRRRRVPAAGQGLRHRRVRRSGARRDL